MEWLVAIVVALITSGAGLYGSFVVARTSSDKVVHQLELNQAVQNERIEAYQRQTNEKIDELRRQNAAQQEYGTKIALLEQRVDVLEGQRG